MRLVLATANRGKLREFAALLAPLGIELIAQTDLGVESVEETGITFEENALLKARHAARTTGLPALADDSGLEVDALDGRPGVYSARYAGSGASDEDNLRKLLRDLDGVPRPRRTARFRCVLAMVHSADDPAPLICEGAWEGHIGLEARGSNGFGYDPIFEIDAKGLTSAQLPPERKNALSHRGLATARLVEALRVLQSGG